MLHRGISKIEMKACEGMNFEVYAKMWIPLVNKFGGTHHGYSLPHERINNIAVALFSFPSLADYETYRNKMWKDPDCIKAFEHYLGIKDNKTLQLTGGS